MSTDAFAQHPPHYSELFAVSSPPRQDADQSAAPTISSKDDGEDYFAKEKGPWSSTLDRARADIVAMLDDSPRRGRIAGDDATKEEGTSTRWVTDLGFEETRRAIGRAFSGTDTQRGEPVFEWALDHVRWDSVGAKRDVVTFMAFTDMSDGLFTETLPLALRDEDTGDVIATANICEYDCSLARWKPIAQHLWQVVFVLWQVLQGHVPNFFFREKHRQDRDRMMAKVKLFMKQREEWHKRYCPIGRHWQVKNISVNPDYQGRGYGLELMRKLNWLADRQRIDCYLETAGGGLRRFYELCGYRVIGHEILVEDDPAATAGGDHFPAAAGESGSGADEGGSPPLDVYFMVREAKRGCSLKESRFIGDDDQRPPAIA